MLPRSIVRDPWRVDLPVSITGPLTGGSRRWVYGLWGAAGARRCGHGTENLERQEWALSAVACDLLLLCHKAAEGRFFFSIFPLSNHNFFIKVHKTILITQLPS